MRRTTIGEQLYEPEGTPDDFQADLARYSSPPLVKFTCPCGCKCMQFLRPDAPRLCLDCRDAADRKANGWTPANSID